MLPPSAELGSGARPLSPDNQQVQPGARGALSLLLLINLFNYIDRYILAVVVPDKGEHHVEMPEVQ